MITRHVKIRQVFVESWEWSKQRRIKACQTGSKNLREEEGLEELCCWSRCAAARYSKQTSKEASRACCRSCLLWDKCPKTDWSPDVRKSFVCKRDYKKLLLLLEVKYFWRHRLVAERKKQHNLPGSTTTTRVLDHVQLSGSCYCHSYFAGRSLATGRVQAALLLLRLLLLRLLRLDRLLPIFVCCCSISTSSR